MAKVDGLRDATNGVRQYRNRFEKNLLLAARTGAQRVTEWEKQNHPWQNVTRQAEQKIKCVAFREGNKIIMENAHHAIDKDSGFKYGIALELRHDGRYAILQVALRRFYSFVGQNFKDRMESESD